MLPALVAGYLVQVGWRVWLAVGRHGPVVLADEVGYLLDGRLLSGGAAGQMTGSMFYRGGYALLIWPAFQVSHDPRRVYALVLAVNAVLAGAVFPLLYYLCTRTFRIPAWPAVAVSFLGALYPPLVLYSLLALPEVVLYVGILGVAVALSRFVAVRRRGPIWAWALGCGLLTGFLYTTHGRTAPVVAVALAGLVLIGALRSDLRLPAAAGLATAGVTLWAGQVMNDLLARRIWGQTSGTGGGVVLHHLTDPGVVPNLGAVAVGQYWYFTVGTFGLFGLGVCQAVAVLRRGAAPGLGPGTGPPAAIRAIRSRLGPAAGGGPVGAAFLLLATAVLVVLTGVFLFPVTRTDTLVYGRYAEVLMPAFVALGLYRLWTLRPAWRGLVELASGLGLAAVAFPLLRNYHDRLLLGPISNSYTTLSLPWMSGSIQALHPGRVLAVALVGGAVLAALCRRLRALAALGLAGVLVLSAHTTRRDLFTHTQTAVYGPGDADQVRVPGLSTPQDVGYDLGHGTVEGRWAFQWALPDTHFVLFDSAAGQPAPPVRYVISGRAWPQAARLGARQVWSERFGDQTVWLIPSRPPAPLTSSDPADR
ncbi:MAG TPA: hypothetical protein VFX70_01205 [Mycobacteriales bacterium]|nr:hypothetical protein [Mycobacteriales bacterium]